jgi:hypothetical protein
MSAMLACMELRFVIGMLDLVPFILLLVADVCNTVHTSRKCITLAIEPCSSGAWL